MIGAGDEAGSVTLVDLHKRFGDAVAVEKLNLEIPAGSFFALLGPSGCGKTTTLRMVAGLEVPTSGQVLIGDEEITFIKPYKRPVNTVFQSYALFPHLDIFENVAFGLRRTGVEQGGDRQAGRRGARARAADAVRAPQARAALRGAAAACRAGPGAGQPPQGPAARRAIGCPRPQAAQADADRAQAHPDRGRHHVRARHPRPGGGHDDGRHHRRDARRAHGAAGHAGRPLRAPDDGVRRGLPRSVQPAVGHLGARRRGARSAPCRVRRGARPRGPGGLRVGLGAGGRAAREDRAVTRGERGDERAQHADRDDHRRELHGRVDAVPREDAVGRRAHGLRAEPRGRRAAPGRPVALSWDPLHTFVVT